jgi:hypothetical protein
MAFEFSVSSNTLSLSPAESGRITITQTSSDPQSVQYGVSSLYAGGWDRMPLDQFGNITYRTSPSPARLTGNGTLTLTFSASSSAQAGTLIVQVYGLQQTSGDPNSAVNHAQTVTLAVT